MTPYIIKFIQKYRNSIKVIVGASVFIIVVQIVASVCLKSIVGDIGSKYFWMIKYITYECPLYRLGDYILGCNLCALFLNKKINMNKYLFNVSEVLFVLLNILNIYLYNAINIPEEFKYSLFYLIGAIGLVFIGARADGLFSKLLNNKCLIYIGNISGYAFLVHFLVIICELIRRMLNFRKNI